MVFWGPPRCRGQRSWLVGTAHFFPYRFRKALCSHIGAAALYRDLSQGGTRDRLAAELRPLERVPLQRMVDFLKGAEVF
jgi:hypothetical protein